MMRMHVAPLLAAIGSLAWLAGIAAGTEEVQKFQHPVLRAPKMARAPTVDGRIDPGEWDGAAALTGLASLGGVGPYSMVPQVQQVTWYIGYDDRFLYLAMHSPHPKGTYPEARVKENDSQALLFEDHVEVQILTHDRKDARLEGKGFYKIMANPKGAVMDLWYYNGTPGSETLWSMGGPLKCSVVEDAWQLEMAVELSRMGLESLDGRSLVIQLVRADSSGGFYFAGWSPHGWTGWAAFGRVDFDPDAPVIRYTRTGEIMTGDLDTRLSVTGAGKPTEVLAEVLVDDADGKRIYHEQRRLTVGPGGRAEAVFRKSGLPISPVSHKQPRRNWFEIKATAGDTVLYHNRQPFVALDGPYRDEYLNKWLAGRPQSGEWECRLAYLPYSDKAEVAVDLDFFGVPPRIAAADSFRVEIRARGGQPAGRKVAEGAAPIRERVGTALVDVPPLEDGDYDAVFVLLDRDGKRSVAEKTVAFERRRYPFEHNRLGINDEVIPPFRPIEQKGNSLVVWGGEYRIGAGGLLDALNVRLPTGQRDAAGPSAAAVRTALLAAPMRLELRSGGATIAPSDAAVRFASSAGHRVEVAGSQTLGDLRADVAAAFEYDGWYGVTLTLSPQKPVAADALDLTVDLNDFPTDTLYVQRAGDGLAGNRFGGIPAAPGVFFQSTDLPAYRDRGKDWLSFVPVAYAGNGDRGLWFFAWTDVGWELRPGQPALRLERMANGRVRMTVRLLAGPVVIEAPRVLRFAFQGAPMKPNHPRYRTFREEGTLLHETPGYRYYGDSVDGYALHSEEDYAALRRFLLYGPRYQDDKQYSYAANQLEMRDGYVPPLRSMYGSTFMGGLGAPEHRTYGGEWLGRSNWKPSPDFSYAGRFNYQGTVRWSSPEQLSPAWYNWTASHNDFFIWYHKPLMEKCGINGTWWDNASIGTIREYCPVAGQMVLKFNLEQRRNLLKRLNHLGWELMRPPMWISNMHAVDIPFNQVVWQIENDWHSPHIDYTAFDAFALDQYRAMTRTKTTMLIPTPSYGGFFRDWEKHPNPARGLKIGRSLAAIQLLHDIVPMVWYGNVQTFVYPLRRKLDAAVGLPDTARCLFTGYWNAAPFVTTPDGAIKASFYANAQARGAAVVFVNVSREDRPLAGAVLDVKRMLRMPPLSGGPQTVRRIYDLETGRDVPAEARDGKWRITGDLQVPWHEFVIVAIEAQ